MRRSRLIKPFIIGPVLTGIFVMVGIFFATTPPTSATSSNGFDATNIIADSVFTDYRSMSISDIQAFLVERNSVCLKDLRTLSLNDTNNDGLGDEPYGKGMNEEVPASKLIWQAAQLYEISPKVILATLEKEQGLVTRSDCPDWRYNTALGYGCPDDEPCDDSAYGFTRQIDYGVWHFRGFFDDSNPVPPYVPGSTYIGYNPNGACGGTTINIQNRATSALYSYTPYQPNPATLAANVGQEVNCGAYGNLNFWRYFTNWFGSTQGVDIYAVRYDTSSDKTGEATRVGFGLSQKPTSDVTLSFYVNSPSNAKIVGKSTLKITRDTWNQPDKNIITTAGLNNTNLSGNFQYSIKLSARPDSSDIRYRSLGSYSVEVNLLQQDTASSPNVYRLYSSSLQRHIFTASLSERNQLISQGWRDEGIPFSYCRAGEQTIVRHTDGSDYQLVVQNSSTQRQAKSDGLFDETVVFAASSQGSIPVYWRYNETQQRSLYTTSTTEGLSAGFVDRGVAFYACEPTSKPVYRLRKPGNSHFYTNSARERDKAIYELGYNNEGLGFYACSSGDVPVYRFIKESNGIRFYTTSARERDKVTDELGYRYEGIGFYLCDDGPRNVYRLYNTPTGARFYTISSGERDRAVELYDYTYEGVGFRTE